MRKQRVDEMRVSQKNPREVYDVVNVSIFWGGRVLCTVETLLH
jgi:hypothetical protein